MKNGFFRVAAAVIDVRPADCTHNVNSILEILSQHCTPESGIDVVTFPEMCITAYTCADLFHSSQLIEDARKGLTRICEASRSLECLIVVGAPVASPSALLNCAVAINRGKIVGIVPKTYLPTYNEFYERRWFASSMPEEYLCAELDNAPVSSRNIFKVGDVGVAIEICEDLWAPIPPSTYAAMQGAEVVVNLSASDDLIGKYDLLTGLIANQSARAMCAYVYASAGSGESSTDLVFDGKTFIAECGKILARNKRWTEGNRIVVADVDIDLIRHNRITVNTFDDCRRRSCHEPANIVGIPACENAGDGLLRSINPHPFVPSDPRHRSERCEEIINIQTSGLATRLKAINCRNAVIGISGGLDSTLALLVTCRAFDRLGVPRTGITGITMPGFGTTDRTYDNALTLMRSLGITIREIPIGNAVTQHFSDIGHDASVHDITYENCQARERTQILMDVANQTGGIVIGTGDMSELALGWATYNGDHMSMYGVNAGVPKTLVRYLVEQFAMTAQEDSTADVLRDIIDTPISPELIPADEAGNIVQKTEDLVGPYELHDFFLYHTLRNGFTPRRIYRLACAAFCPGKKSAPICDAPAKQFSCNEYDKETIKKWLTTFFRRFFAQQFKRSCLPDGPKVGSVCLSPRGDWRMPSDARSASWLKECEELIE